MSDAIEQLDVVETQEIVTPTQDEANASEAELQPALQPPKEDVQDKNWKAARARMDEQSRQNQLLERQLQLMERELDLLRQSKPVAPQAEEDETYLTDSEKKLNDKIKKLDRRLQEKEAKEKDYVTERLKSRYPDFDDVVCHENVDYLKTNNAALAKALASLADDPYEQGLAVYDALKRTEWYQKRHTMEDKAKVAENVKKPVSVQAVRKTGPLSEANTFANGLTKELKEQLRKEMAEARKGG